MSQVADTPQTTNHNKRLEDAAQNVDALLKNIQHHEAEVEVLTKKLDATPDDVETQLEVGGRLSGLTHVLQSLSRQLATAKMQHTLAKKASERDSLLAEHAQLNEAIRAFDATAKERERELVLHILNSIREFRAGVATRDEQHRKMRAVEDVLASQHDIYLADPKLTSGYFHGIDRAGANGGNLEKPETMALIAWLGIHRENYRDLQFHLRELGRIA